MKKKEKKKKKEEWVGKVGGRKSKIEKKEK